MLFKENVDARTDARTDGRRTPDIEGSQKLLSHGSAISVLKNTQVGKSTSPKVFIKNYCFITFTFLALHNRNVTHRQKNKQTDKANLKGWGIKN